MLILNPRGILNGERINKKVLFEEIDLNFRKG